MASRTLRCAIYTRKSSEEGLEQRFNSLHAQREACEAYVLSQAGEGWVALPTIYDDGGYSGGSMERPALAQLLADIEAQRIDIVVVYKVDRLTRALSDFARIVEVFDKQGVSFVSVTQAFNTTSSMGRLTLNVLLSFAQFEREVTGERFRDKIGASKAKGMWMGGNVPLGYDVPTDQQTRALVVNPSEAETVRLIFQRYVDLESVRALAADLRERAVTTKQWTAANGRRLGGDPWREGPLYHVLKNRIYLGDIVHKGQVHAGRHMPIVSAEVFEAVQERLRLRKTRRRTSGQTPVAAPLVGKIFDDRGHPMSPVTARRGGRSYRYYVSQAVIRRDSGAPGSVTRIAAWPIEAAVARENMQRSGTDSISDASAQLQRIVVMVGAAELQWKRAIADDEAAEVVRVPMGHGTGRGATTQLAPNRNLSDELGAGFALMRAIARARRWEGQLATGERACVEDIVAAEGLTRRYVDKVIKLAWLAPDLTEALIAGDRFLGVHLSRLVDNPLSARWDHQRIVLTASEGVRPLGDKKV